MTDHKFTDEEVIKALVCCVEGTSEACLKCVFGLNPPYPVCKIMVEKHALDLINRQKAEIERLEKINSLSTRACQELRKGCKTARAGAIKEFAERLKEKAYIQKPYGAAKVVDEYAVDDLVKEMTEGKDHENISD